MIQPTWRFAERIRSFLVSVARVCVARVCVRRYYSLRGRARALCRVVERELTAEPEAVKMGELYVTGKEADMQQLRH